MKAARAILAAVTLVGLVACATTSGRSTTLRGEDVLDASDSLRASLVSSRFLAERTAGSSPASLGFGPIENRSNERITGADRRAVVARALLRQDVLDLLRAKNIAVVLPPPSAEELERLGLDVRSARITRDLPTHVVEGSLRSASRSAQTRGSLRDVRSDLFLFDLVIVETESRRTVWAGTHELARAARGALLD